LFAALAVKKSMMRERERERERERGVTVIPLILAPLSPFLSSPLGNRTDPPSAPELELLVPFLVSL